MTFRYRGRALIAVLAIGASGLLWACERDSLVAPRRLQPDNPSAHDWNAPNSVTAQLTANVYNGGGETDSPLGQYPTETIVNVVASGFVVQHDNFNYYPDWNFGPGGRTNAPPQVAVVVVRTDGTSYPVVFPFNNNQDTDSLTIDLKAGYSIQKVGRDPVTSGLRRWPWYINNQYVYCDTWTNPPCYTFSGGHTIQITPIAASFWASADSSDYAIGSTAMIKMTITPATINVGGTATATPVQIDSSMWAPAADSLGGDAADTVPLNACINARHIGADYACDHAVNGAGTLTIIGHANGTRQVQRVQIKVRNPALLLTANPAALSKAGDTVTFTPRWSDGAPITSVVGWSWQPDTLPSLMGPACGTSDVTCLRAVPQVGTMFVTVSRDGRQRTARVHVAIVPCPFNNPFLDDPAVRAGFADLWNSSNAGNSDTTSRREKRIFFYSDNRGRYSYQLSYSTGNNTPCKALGETEPAPPVGTIRVADGHDHPFQNQDSLPSNCKFPDDTAGAPPHYHKYDTGKFGGPSEQDWLITKGGGMASWVIDKTTLYRMDPNVEVDSSLVSGQYEYSVKPNFSNYLETFSRVGPNGCVRF